MAGSATIPTWLKLFGSLDTKDADAGRSLTAPAAYLADLLQLLYDRFDTTDFNKRRPDIASQIKLNGDQSFTLKRQLDIINVLLGDRIASQENKTPAEKVLAAAQQPFLLPFEYQHERIKQILLLLKTPYRDLYSSFTPNIDANVLARERLGLSPARAAVVMQDLSGEKPKLGAAYGLKPHEPVTVLTGLKSFQQATQLDGPSLRVLLFSQLSQSPGATGTDTERKLSAGKLFINHGLGDFVQLDANEESLVWNDPAKTTPEMWDQWFDRVHRLLRLSRWTGIDLPSIDLVLRQLCNNKLDQNAMWLLAVLVDLRDRTQAPIDVLCALFSELEGDAALGAGDDPLNPASLFDRVFNGAAALLSKRYLRARTDYLPQTYAPTPDWQELKATGDVLLDLGDNKLLRARIQAGLGISAIDLAAIITRFRDRATDRGRVSQLVSMDSHGLSVLHRVAKLAEFADLAPLDLLTLLEVLENDPNLKVLNAFDVLHHEDITQTDLYQVLEQGSIRVRSWLIQNILAIAAWAGLASLEPEDLQGIVVPPADATPAQESTLLTIAQALHDAFLPTALSPTLLQSDAINARTADLAMAVFQQPKWGLVSARDARIGIWDKHKARDAAYAALASLDVVSVADLEALPLGEDLATYLQTLLIQAGVLDTNGMLLEDKFPLQPENLVLETDGTAQFAQIFDYLQGLYTTALSEATAAAANDSGDQSDSDQSDSDTTDDSTQDSVDADTDSSDDTATGSADDGAGDDTSAANDTDVADDTVSANDTSTANGSSTADVDTDTTDDASTTDDTDTTDDSSTPDAVATAPDPSSDIQLHLYPSDLLKLGFSTSDAIDWIDRLTFLQILDDSGMVQEPSLFSDPANLDSIQVNVGLNSFSSEIYAWLEARRNSWLSATVTLPDGLWDPLPLSDAERDGLQQNLVFNHHIDAANRIQDPEGLAALTPDTFDLALPFYRHRRLILNALQGVVASARQQSLTITPDDLRPLADKFTATDIHEALSTAYLDAAGRLTAEILADIDNEQPPFEIGSWYSAAQSLSVWNLLQQINSDASKFRLTDAALASVKISDDHATNVVVSLCAEGCLQPDRSLTQEQAKRFAMVSSAQDFVIPEYVDYSKDVFFLIHDVAAALQAAVKALTSSFQAAVKAQDNAVIGALASQVQLSPEGTWAVARPLLRDEPSPTVAIMEPVLRAAVNDVLLEPPSNRMFRETMNRTQGFANFAAKLRMTPQQIEAAFKDQQLVEKFPEGIELPKGADGIDAVWAGPSGAPSGSSTFSVGDFVDLPSLADKLAQPSRPIDLWLAAQVTPETTAALEDYLGQGADPTTLQKILLEDVNRVLMGPSIYDTQRFSGVTLRPKIERLLTLGLPGGDAPALNRLLIEDAYPQELAKNQLYLFRGPHYWTFDANTLELNDGPLALETLSSEFKGVPAVDAVYTLVTGEHWLLAQGNAWRRAADSDHWTKATGLTARLWGRVKSLFDDPANIDGILLDHEGRVYLFCGDQYVRYSTLPPGFVDEGYPKQIAAHWPEEIGFGPLPLGWNSGIDAGVGRGDEVTWLFKDDKFVASTEPQLESNIIDFWGHVRNNLDSASRVDAVLDIEGRCGVSVGDQVSIFSNSLESNGLSADEGYPQKLSIVFPDLPEVFAQRIDAGLTDDDGSIHLFCDLKCATRAKDGKWETLPVTQHWGHVSNNLQQTGHVDAAFAGLDGKVYLFSGNQYIRYSGADLSRIDEGYPRTISRDWGGLTAVDVAFVLDGKTYLFSSDDKSYVCYSTRDYTKPDVGFPMPIDENWWNLPVALVNANFHHPDAVFIAGDGRIHLFRGNQTIHFDHNHRWWSEPVPIHQDWTSLPFETVSAGFTGRDGRAYLFSSDKDGSFVRYTDKKFQRLDDRFPKPVKEHWGKLVNNIERSGRVDAAVAIVSSVSEKDEGGKVVNRKVRYRYLFSGDQFYRYSSDGQQFVDEGYPLRIQSSLRHEPYFAHLDAPADQGIDGAWADTGNVYVFIAGRIYVASFDHCRQLDGLGIDGARAADVEDGRLTVFGENGWRHILPPEAHMPGTSPDRRPADYVRLLPEPDEAAVPRVLCTAPAQFQLKLSAILRGLDKNVYLFGDTQCYDRSLERQYPTGSAWGLISNRIADEERVDSALMGRDGKLYLFRGDQFITYTPTVDAPTKIPAVADANPLPITDHWGGLNNVSYAFVEKGVTYLLESPQDDGAFRYVRYFGTDYSKPNDPAPLAGDFTFWEIPQSTVNRGFDRVDAVFADGDDFILIRDFEFIHYDAKADIWSIPRHLPLRWPGLVKHFPDFETIDSVIRGPDNLMYFFADGTWLKHDGDRPSALSPISSRWALLQNRITQENRVDATLVCGDKTFLFSGDQYARYTGSDYEYVDLGYPRPIAGLLRRETAFLQLPPDIETAFLSLKPEDVWVSAAFCTGGVVVVSMAGQTYALSAQLSRTYPLQQVSNVRNELLRRAEVDAAFAREDRALFLLSGDQYVRYSQPDLDVVDDGYPRSIGESLLSELPGKRAPLPLNFQLDLDAVLYDNGVLYLFKDKQFVRSDENSAVALVPMDIKGTWGRVSNPFFAANVDQQPPLDAAFVAPDKALYVFKGEQYLRYTDPTADFVDEGYPREIRDLWADLPDDFKNGIDGAFVFDGRTYLCRENQFVRYSDSSYKRMDPIYPQLFSNRWRASNNFLLGDLRAIQRYVALDQANPSDSGSLTDLLLARPHDNADPYTLLATLFTWDVTDVEWLKQRDAFLNRPSRDLAAEVKFNIPLALRIYDTLQLCGRVGSHPQEMYEQVWTPLYRNQKPTTAANTLERLLGTLYPGDDWTRIQRQLYDALANLLRDAQVGWLLARHPAKLTDARALSDLLLTDVEMDASQDTSPIVEATGALQLYYYRYLTNLEPALITGDDTDRRAEFKKEWQWIQNYRVWEANRKVFLYPESYIRPELRTSRTDSFKTLQQNLQQGDITNDSVTQAYKLYLDDYTAVSRLIIAGGYVWQPDPTKPNISELTLFGFTRTDPRNYYFRSATFDDNATSPVWNAWQALGITINSDLVYPVRAFGRTFVFWAESEQVKPDDQSTATLQTTTNGNTQQVSGQSQVQYRVKVMYSSLDLSGQWTAPQTLDTGAIESVQIGATYLRVTGMSPTGPNDAESIMVDFTYDLYVPPADLFQFLLSQPLVLPQPQFIQDENQLILQLQQSPSARPLPQDQLALIDTLMGLPPRNRAKKLTADLTVTDIDFQSFSDGRLDILNGLFDPNELATINLDSVIIIGTADRQNAPPWYSFDLKGGSFLARPSVAGIAGTSPDVNMVPLAGNTEGLPQWGQVDACLDGSDGKRYLFNNVKMVYAVLGDSNEPPIDSRWGLRYSKLQADGLIDAAWQRDGVAYLSRGAAYLKYSNGLDWADEIGERGTPADRIADGLPPSWTAVSAAFTDKTNTTWFFQGTQYVTLDANKKLSTPADIRQRWGHEPNDFTSHAKNDPVVVATFNRDGRSFLIGPASYTSYTDADLSLCQPLKPQSLRALLDELKCTNTTDVDAAAVITGAMDGGAELLFKAKSPAGSEIYSFSDGKISIAKRTPKTGPWQDAAAFMQGEKRFAFSPAKTGFAVTVSGSDEQYVYTQDIRAALLSPNNTLYVFSVDSYIAVQPAEISVAGIGKALDQWASRSAPITGRWGWLPNAITEGDAITAAFVKADHTFLVSGTSYVRYTGADYLVTDAGYPKPLNDNPDGLPSAPFTAGLQFPDGRFCFFIGANYAFDNALSVQMPNQARWGRIGSNILRRGVDTAYRIGNKHYLFSGNEIACYTAGADGSLSAYMDQAPLQAELGSFGAVRGAFFYKEFLYIVARDSFVCSALDQPEQTLAEYPRNGQAGTLVNDLRQRFNLPANSADVDASPYEVYALSLQGSILLLDTDDSNAGTGILRFDFNTGRLTRDFQRSQIDWATLRKDGNTFVDLPTARYSFLADKVMKTAKGVPAPWNTTYPVRAISAIWGGRPFDAALPVGDTLYLFIQAQYAKLATSLASDNAGGIFVVKNLRTALAAIRAPIVSGFVNLPAAVLSGLDAVLPVDDGVCIFKGNQYAYLSGNAQPQPVASLKYDIVRLTTSTAARLNRELFVGGVPGLLSLRTQEVGDTPAFSALNGVASSPTMIKVNPDRVNQLTLPLADHLDFASANGDYLWEIFFHAPALIAGMLATAQRFPEAKMWYEYIFDPTEPADAWKFLPFLTDDVERLVLEIRDRLARLDQLKPNDPNVAAARNAISGHLDNLQIMNSAFQGERELTEGETTELATLQKSLALAVAGPLQTLIAPNDQTVSPLAADLLELMNLVADLPDRWDDLKKSQPGQIDTYLDDPFDPHAIAAQRPIAYRKATVMAYLNNLIAWGDMLFGQYTRESINEARMLYVLAWDVLGRRPESLGMKVLPPDSVYLDIAAVRNDPYSMLMQLAKDRLAHLARLSFAASLLQAPPNQAPPLLNPAQGQPYFFIPVNDDLNQYWTKVADRLYKIRHGLNILGVKEPLPLFAPPIDPMALVSAVAGGGLAGIGGVSGAVDVPHYRFTFLVGKAEGLAQGLQQLGSELLAALEKRDAEALTRLQMTQEGIILGLTEDMQKSQLAEAQTNLTSLQQSKLNAQKRHDVYQGYIDVGYLPEEQAQIDLLIAGVVLNTLSAVFNWVSAPLSLLPAITFGLFSFGATEEEFEKTTQAAAMALQSTAGAVQGVGEILGTTAQHKRTVQDWTLQRDLAAIDMAQINAQVAGAQCQIQAAQQQIAITQKQVEQNKAVSDFYHSKFTNQELYEWMASRLSDLHYQTYQLALNMARAAERAFQFERGQSETKTTYIQSEAWDSQRKGLLSGYTLGLALNRMESAFIATDARRFEITKSISLIQLDALAFIKLKTQNACEFDLTESLFDGDFPGHYCRQLKTIAIDLILANGVLANATLTQITSRTIMEPDPKAVSFLLSPKENPPQSIRTNWKAQQQIALSYHTQYETNSGVFELNFDGDHYLPFEGTGAVSHWRLELGGPPNAYDLRTLTDVTITIKYTALQGGDAFAASVRGMLKPTDTLRAFNLNVDFADAWQAFLQGTDTTLQLPLTPSLFPNILGGAIPAIFTVYEYVGQTASGATFTLNLGQQLPLTNGKNVDTSGLTIRASGTTLNLTLKGDRTTLSNVYLLLGYKSGVR